MLMRSAIGLSLAIAAAVPLSAAAQDWTPINDRIISDPTFLPLKGQFYGETSYGYNQTNDHNFDTSGAEFEHIRHSLDTVRQTFEFGVTDNLSLNVREAYGFSGQSRVTSAEGVSTQNSSGFDDPSFGITYRLFDQRTYPAIVDIFGTYSPDAFSSKTGTASQDASVARGGPQADFGLAIARQTRAFTIRGAVTATYLGSSTTTNAVTGGTVEQSSYWAPSLSLQTQTRFTNRLSANLSGSYNFQGSPVLTNNVTGLQHKDYIGDNQNIDVALNYHFIPNKLVGSVSYNHTFYNHGSIDYPTDPILDYTRTRSSDGVGVALRYVFK